MRHGYSAFNSAILDVDGVLWIAGALAEGAIAFLNDLRRAKIPFCLLTNDCSSSKAERYKALTQAGLVLRPTQLVTVAEVTEEWLRKASVQSIMYLGAPATLPDIAKGFRIHDISPVDAVVLGDIFSHYDRDSIDKAAKAIDDGAILVAMQRNPRWSDGRNWYVDNGFWVAGLEYVTGREAVVVGKPNRDAYLAAANRLGLIAQDYSCTAFVSDNVDIDLRGARDVGLATVHFGTEQNLPLWVDHAAHDLGSLASVLIGNDYCD